MYKNILVPIVFDHGPRAEEALAVARELLEPNGKIALLHVIEEIPTYVASQLPKDILRITIEHARASLGDFAQKYAKEARALVVAGHSSQTILEHAAKIDADCIVIASHRPGLKDYFLGSTAARVVRHAECAVHVLR